VNMIFPAPKVFSDKRPCQGRGIAAQPWSLSSAHIYLARGDQGEALGRLARISRATFIVASAMAACPSAVGWKAPL
jgi:hypothetical protein